MRKRRLPRLGTAIWTARPVAKLIGLRLRKAIGNSFTPAQREEIAKLIRDYLLLEGAERAAPSKRDRDSWLDRLYDVAQSLQDILTRMPMHDRAHRDGYAEVQTRFNEIARAAYGHTLPLDLTAAFLVSAVEAANQDELPGFEEKRRWCGLVSKLHSRFTEWGFPSRRPQGRRAETRPSLFFFIPFNSNGLPMHGATCRSMPALAKARYRKQIGTLT